ncbi:MULTISPECIES: RsmB/NOP family class I SAM-dependent RNA methyltransferase [unclassified Novosphingobium]|uniref:RsmB/NOP family class I SAM-dependent RNA methyltransferase n=1 Tax=unclassified Novosphingobium TaxID=2644732 RepID=UPI000D2F6807|nr:MULTISPECIES: methyltransferase domain-containing protein [unclassified Novosphingobium]PTR09869.1 16S rRNA (cytosine967-C5)-methyltransferase [Novosphingobium sp. GV055]PUB02656.1 16S rRNA (cytosine967-C5)-methyltransferase [Novosphingobium sp. GV061]PUB19601.1 16S rRNA (cytosine967-C5)-methyltransferase [Novosphingobium sp. GV079]PUB41025.1 16S rRNA (cytosine967-C5)-methyltransferase [Novosphingobium sp. GV027]
MAPNRQTDETPGVPARRAALRLLDAVLRRGDPLDQAAPPVLRAIERGDDRALAMAIVQEALRWLPDLDALIDSATQTVLPDDAKARAVLQLMLAQALRLGLPPHAVIATGLPLLMGGPRRLAHGVFSALLKRGAALPDAPTLPPAVAARWDQAWPGRTAAIAAGIATPPPLDLSLRDAGETARWVEELGGLSLLPGHVRLPRGQAVESLPGFAEGAWWVQDLAASLPARLLGTGEGRRVLDLCAAPGGKTMQLAAAGWTVTALDKSARRLERLSANLARTSLTATVVQADALKWQPDEPFDAVLLDAPCSATGTCRRHPDVLHRLAAMDELTQLQAQMLARSAAWLRPGGTLVYATCSLEPAEGEAQAAAFAGLDPAPIQEGELPAGIAPTPQGWLRSDPGMLAQEGGIDGFFAARWRQG